MSPETVALTAQRIADHAHRHCLSRVRVVFHGGEPLLFGRDGLASAAATIRRVLQPTRVAFAIQTNGTLLDDRFMSTLLDHRISVGISLDGTPDAHDRHRRHKSGRGSHADVAAAVRRLRRSPYRSLFAGLLCTIDLHSDPVEAYEALLPFEPPTIDFLLPHGTWSHPPEGRTEGSPATPYADWLTALFDRWFDAPRRVTGIRMFDSIIAGLLGGRTEWESIGLGPVRTVTIDTDGSMEQVDALKVAYHGAAATGLHVATNSFDDALSHPAVAARQIGIRALSDVCRRCDVMDVCGGGYYPHRHRRGHGYKNPSVYCPDLYRLIDHVRSRVAHDLEMLQPT